MSYTQQWPKFGNSYDGFGFLGSVERLITLVGFTRLALSPKVYGGFRQDRVHDISTKSHKLLPATESPARHCPV